MSNSRGSIVIMYIFASTFINRFKTSTQVKNKLIVAIALFGLSTLVASCTSGSGAPPSTEQVSTSGAHSMNIGQQFQIPVNGKGNTIEQQNIIDRQVVTNDHSKILWIHLVDMNGRIYLRTPVRGKVTSSGKRLEPSSVAAGGVSDPAQGTYHLYGTKTPEGMRTSERLQIDGTYGSSDAYIYWFDPRGYYYQKGDGYILSDMPINTKAPVDEVTGLYNIDEAAKKWQQSQTTGGTK